MIRLSKQVNNVVALAIAAVMGLACDSGSGEDGHDEGGHDEDGHGHEHDNESEIITTISLSFAPEDGGPTIVARFVDPDGDSPGQSGTADTIRLAAGATYELGVEFSNELAQPAEDITEEVAEECEEHQLFVFGDAVQGPATTNTDALVTHAYADLESSVGVDEVGEDLPVGLTNSIVANAAGEGTFEVMLRHMPPLNGAPQKVPGLAEALAGGEALPGEPDVLVQFPLIVE